MQLVPGAHGLSVGDVAVFNALFNSWIVDVVKADPTIVRVAHWKCYR